MQYHIAMAKGRRIVDRMRRSPLDWRIEDFKTVARAYGIPYRQPGTSHVTFCFSDRLVTVPAHKPVKPVYVQQFVRAITDMEGRDD